MNLYQMDAVRFLQTLEPESIDLLITDPPYESLEKHRSKGTTTRLSHSKASSNDWFKIFPNNRLLELAENLYRVMAKNSHCYIMCDQETMFVLVPLMQKAGFKFWKPIIWDKVCIGMGYHYRARYECVLFFEKGKRKLNNLGMADILTHKRIVKGYPTEKPVSLFEDLIMQSSREGETFCDPFFGSGASLVAAKAARLTVYGNDLSDDAHAYLKNRVDNSTRIACQSPTDDTKKQIIINTVKGDFNFNG